MCNRSLTAWGAALLVILGAGAASAAEVTPTGQALTPDAAPDSRGYVFVYDVTGAEPAMRQALQVANSYLGLAWSPDGRRFYVSGGVDDRVVEFAAGPRGYAQSRAFPLGHKAGL